MNRRTRLMAVAAAFGCAAACGGGGDAGSPAQVAVEEWSVAAALAEIPDDGADQFDLYTADLRRADEVLGLERPTSGADVRTVWDDWLLPLTLSGEMEDDRRDYPLWVHYGQAMKPLMQGFDEFAAARRLLGWSIVDVDAFVDYRPTPPAPYLVVSVGVFPESALSGLELVSEGIVTVGSGADLEFNLGGRHPLDDFGRPVRLARGGDRIAASLSTQLLADWRAGASRTRADDDELRAVAEALDAADVAYAYLSRHSREVDTVYGAASAEERAAVAGAVVLEERFDTVGVGWTVVAGWPRVVIVYAAQIAQSADDLADQLKIAYSGARLWNTKLIADAWGVKDLEVTVDGSVVTVTYRPDGAFWVAPLYGIAQAEVPFIHR